MKKRRLYPKAAGAGLVLAVLAVSLCAARCAAPKVPMPCHGEAGDRGICAAFASQTWAAPPDLTVAVLALLLVLALALGLAPRFSAAFSCERSPLFAEKFSSPPKPCRISGVSPRAPPRRR